MTDSALEYLPSPDEEVFELAAPEGRQDQIHEDSIRLERRGISQPTQSEFWMRQTSYKFAVAAKLREAGRADLAADLENCHSHYTVRQCNGCGKVEKFANRCERHYCPECQPRLSHDRQEATRWWTFQVQQPKHVVLTVKNVPDLSSGHFDELKKWFTNLRRRKFARHWRGGLWRVEVTNEGRGWHLHIHALIDADFIAQDQLSIQWEHVTGGMGRIVRVKDARRQDYLLEVTKYTVKGVQLAAWSAEKILAFVLASDGHRLFGTFGSLFAQSAAFKEFWLTYSTKHLSCPCGSCEFRFFDENEFEWHQATLRGPPEPPAPEAQLLFFVTAPAP